jgi:hypothetical protein
MVLHNHQGRGGRGGGREEKKAVGREEKRREGERDVGNEVGPVELLIVAKVVERERRK